MNHILRLLQRFASAEHFVRRAWPHPSDLLQSVAMCGRTRLPTRARQFLHSSRCVFLALTFVSQARSSERACIVRWQQREAWNSKEGLVLIFPSALCSDVCSLFSEVGSIHSVTPVADWWSLGVILFELLTGKVRGYIFHLQRIFGKVPFQTFARTGFSYCAKIVHVKSHNDFWRPLVEKGVV